MEQVSRDELCQRINIAGHSLSRLGVVNPNAYAIDGEGAYFKLIGERQRRIENAATAWYKSLNTEATLWDCTLLERLLEWIHRKQETVQSALDNKLALHFDILVLGIVSTIRHRYVMLN